MGKKEKKPELQDPNQESKPLEENRVENGIQSTV